MAAPRGAPAPRGSAGKSPGTSKTDKLVIVGIVAAAGVGILLLFKMSGPGSPAGGTAYGSTGTGDTGASWLAQTTATSGSGSGATTPPAVSTPPPITGNVYRPKPKPKPVTMPAIFMHVPHPALHPNRLL